MTQNLPTMVYSAPEMAMLQTAQQFINGAKIGMNWLVEPGLVRYFEPYEPRPSNCQLSSKRVKKKK